MFLTIVRRFHSSTACQNAVRKYHFIDTLRFHVQGGGGGQGIKKLTGVGGKGGDVYLQGKLNYSLARIKKKGLTPNAYKAGVGGDATKRRVLGDAGEDLTLSVPVGVTVTDGNGNVLGEINKEGERLLVATGAPGGGPRNDYIGRRASGNHVRLDLKLLADVGLVGFPNAGKSTLLSKLSRANPHIANYPFTTLRPQIGVIEYQDLAQISVADLPGLVEGAHVNYGLGHKFLKHVERTKLLLFVVDVNGFQFKYYHKPRSPLETALALMKELELFNPDLAHRRALLCLNKVDANVDSRIVDDIAEELRNIDETVSDRADVDPEIVPKTIVTFDSVVTVSARDEINIDGLISHIRTAVDREAAKRDEENLDAKDRDFKLDDFRFHLTAKNRNYLV